MECRRGCGACCIAPSINTSLPGMPGGKPAGVACVNLEPITLDCRLWGSAQYPPLCRKFVPRADTCGDTAGDAMRLIGELEIQSR